MNPNEVISPQNKVSNVEVLYVDKDGGYSIAMLEWNHNKRIAIRWNGADDSSSLGYPHSHGYATWFIIPKQVALAFALQSDNLKMSQIIKACDDYVFA